MKHIRVRNNLGWIEAPSQLAPANKKRNATKKIKLYSSVLTFERLTYRKLYLKDRKPRSWLTCTSSWVTCGKTHENVFMSRMAPRNMCLESKQQGACACRGQDTKEHLYTESQHGCSWSSEEKSDHAYYLPLLPMDNNNHHKKDGLICRRPTMDKSILQYSTRNI